MREKRLVPGETIFASDTRFFVSRQKQFAAITNRHAQITNRFVKNTKSFAGGFRVAASIRAAWE